MKCPKCGTECADGVRFCTECGAPITESESSNTNASQAKPEAREAERPAPAAQSGSTAKRPRERRIFGLSRRLALIIAAAAAVIIIVAVAAVVIGNADRSGYTVKTGTYYAAPTAHTLADSHGRLYDLSEYSVNSYIIRPSLDGETAVILGKKDAGDTSGVLLLLSKARLSKIADDVYDCAISDNGAAVAYAVPGDGAGTLYLYNVSKQSASLVSGGMICPSLEDIPILSSFDIFRGMFVLSPDGKSIAFAKKVNEGVRAYVSVKGSEPAPIAVDSYPVALSNNGKYIYFIRHSLSLAAEYNFKFSVAHGDEVRHLSLDAANLGKSLIFNADRTEVVFADDGSTYVSRKGGERRRITSGEINGIVVPGSGAARREEFPALGCRADIYARRSIGGSAYISDGGLYYLNKALEISVITSSYGGSSISSDGKSLYYIDTSAGRSGSCGSVYYLDDVEKNGNKQLVTASIEATSVVAPDKMDGVYVTDLDRTLWFVGKNGKKQKRICDEVSDFGVDRKGGSVYFASALEDHSTVWYSKRGSKKKAMVKADAAAVASQNFMHSGVFFTFEGTADSGTTVSFCRVLSGKKYEVLLTYAK